jgi:hypothetical protein
MNANRMFVRMFVVALVVLLTAGPALARGGGGGDGGAGGGGGAGAAGGVAGGNGNGNAGGNGNGNAGGNGNGVAAGQGNGNGPAVGSSEVGHSGPVGAGRGTAITAPGSVHRSDRAAARLAAPRPGNANPPSGVVPGFGHVGTVPTTPGHQAP